MSRRITIVAHEFRGIRPVGGMGTATTFLALALARMGHSVELLLGRDTPPALEPYWTNVYEEAGIRLRRAPRAECEPWHFLHAHCIELALREAPPDVVIAHDFGGPAYTALRLREAGIAFDETLFVTFCHGTRRYLMDLMPNLAPKDLHNLLAVVVHEQAAVELTDVVVSPSAYLVDWMRAAGWQLPARTFVIPHPTRATATGQSVATRTRRDAERLERLSFFGRVDEKKGVAMFVAALNALEPQLLEGLELEFVGKTTPTWTRERVQALLSAETRQALRNVSFETQLDQHEALERLSLPGTLAVMPSLSETFSNAVHECLEHGIPFLASNVGGVPELVAAQDQARVLVDATTGALAAALRRLLADRTVPPPAHAAVSGEESLRRWAKVVELQPELRADRAAANDFVLLIDDEDVPAPELYEVLARAQARTGADVVTCGLWLERGGEKTLHFFSGDAGGLGTLANTYGTVALVRRALVGATEDAMWPLLARLVASGALLVSIPAPLVTSRAEPGSIERNPGDALLVAQELEKALPGPLRTTARLVAGLASAR